MTTHTSGAADLPEAPTTFCWATELAMTQEPVTLSVAEAREISAEMQRLHALAAGQAVAPATIAIPRETLISWSQCCAQCLSLRVQMEIDEILYPDDDTPARPAPPAMDGGEDAAKLKVLLKCAENMVETVDGYDPDELMELDDDPHPPSSLNAASNALRSAMDAVAAARAAQKEGEKP